MDIIHFQKTNYNMLEDTLKCVYNIIFDVSYLLNVLTTLLFFNEKCLFPLSYPSKQITNLIYNMHVKM